MKNSSLLLTASLFGAVLVALVLPKPVWAAPLPLTTNAWRVLYDGYGEVSWNANETVSFEPQQNDGSTSAVLILSLAKARDFELNITATTIRQLKTTPELWEVFWVMFNIYRQIGGNDAVNKTSNYFILKPNGCELGTASDAVAQNFLATTSTPNLAFGTAYLYTITKRGKCIFAAIDGNEVFNDCYDALYDQEGYIGLYCEDAAVYVSSVDFTSTDGSAAIGSWISFLQSSWSYITA